MLGSYPNGRFCKNAVCLKEIAVLAEKTESFFREIHFKFKVFFKLA